mmetsp:Transcript_14349/g.39649  ORF Transcript_14349/g.39649 Transcript_14349/m.39649 type:complete len:226 (-) Transcript_14349:2-679(-)
MATPPGARAASRSGRAPCHHQAPNENPRLTGSSGGTPSPPSRPPFEVCAAAYPPELRLAQRCFSQGPRGAVARLNDCPALPALPTAKSPLYGAGTPSPPAPHQQAPECRGDFEAALAPLHMGTPRAHGLAALVSCPLPPSSTKNSCVSKRCAFASGGAKLPSATAAKRVAPPSPWRGQPPHPSPNRFAATPAKLPAPSVRAAEWIHGTSNAANGGKCGNSPPCCS